MTVAFMPALSSPIPPAAAGRLAETLAAGSRPAGGLPVRSPDALAAARARALVAARRHSRLVRVLRWAIPLGVVGWIAFSILSTIYDPLRRLADGGVTVGPVNLSGSRVTMDAPRLSGRRNDGRPFELVAVTAVQDLRNPDVIELNDLTARVTLADGRIATVRAQKGLYNTRAERMDLDTAVRVTTDDGADISLADAAIDFRSGHVTSKKSVKVLLNGTLIDAGGLEIQDSGRIIDFTGPVQSRFEGSVNAGLKEDSSP